MSNGQSPNVTPLHKVNKNLLLPLLSDQLTPCSKYSLVLSLVASSRWGHNKEPKASYVYNVWSDLISTVPCPRAFCVLSQQVTSEGVVTGQLVSSSLKVTRAKAFSCSLWRLLASFRLISWHPGLNSSSPPSLGDPEDTPFHYKLASPTRWSVFSKFWILPHSSW
jgi:hypothetical protein